MLLKGTCNNSKIKLFEDLSSYPLTTLLNNIFAIEQQVRTFFSVILTDFAVRVDG